MKELNSRLAHYIETSRYNESENKRLMQELQRIKEIVGKENDSIKNMYETELRQLRTLLDNSEQEKMKHILTTQTEKDSFNELLEMLKEFEELERELKEKIESKENDLLKCESEVSMLKRQNSKLLSERQREKNKIEKVRADLARVKAKAILNAQNNNLKRELSELHLEFDKMIIEKNTETEEIRNVMEKTLLNYRQ
ncbi:60 kDa neurofilament protein-like [Octopus sinensis]|uniref:60 kDa neurofilament protein-like n=1 Tax=Octopus sinensis TaxID=2607531 RepID=A0A6P7TV44_9MOLL|nr:60 kDa neurofilament protein-like [Octopus sinensis]